MLFTIVSVLLIVSGGYLTYKVIDSQDFEHEEYKYKWINYIFASVGAGWVVPSVFNLIGSVFGVTLISLGGLILGLIWVGVFLAIFHRCDYQGRKLFRMFNT